MIFIALVVVLPTMHASRWIWVMFLSSIMW
jgi:hypothetical protein